jgi:hypothetical protein
MDFEHKFDLEWKGYTFPFSVFDFGNDGDD